MDAEIRVNTGTILAALCWLATITLTVVACWCSEWRYAAVAVPCSALAVVLSVRRDSEETRRVMRALLRDRPDAPTSLHGEGGRR